MLAGGMEQVNHQSTDIEEPQVGQVLDALAIYGDLAASEALTRALIAERTGRRDQARYWVSVFEKIALTDR